MLEQYDVSFTTENLIACLKSIFNVSLIRPRPTEMRSLYPEIFVFGSDLMELFTWNISTTPPNPSLQHACTEHMQIHNVVKCICGKNCTREYPVCRVLHFVVCFISTIFSFQQENASVKSDGSPVFDEVKSLYL